MTTPSIRFDDGAAYERFMGVWSRLVGEVFLDWLAPRAGLRWLDVGCGNGAFTAMLAGRCAPTSLDGVDPSEAQLVYARQVPALAGARFEQGDAMALPYADDAFDAAVMPLVIFFVPDPARGVAEMARVVSPGGLVTAYAWDMMDGGFPYASLRDALGEFGYETPMPPSPTASKLDVLQSLWAGAGLTAVETTVIAVERTYPSFEEYWSIVQGGPSATAVLRSMPPEALDRFKEILRERLGADGAGRITSTARAHAIRGQVPG